MTGDEYIDLTVQMPTSMLATVDKLGAWLGAASSDEILLASIQVGLCALTQRYVSGFANVDAVLESVEAVAERENGTAISQLARMRFVVSEAADQTLDGFLRGWHD